MQVLLLLCNIFHVVREYFTIECLIDLPKNNLRQKVLLSYRFCSIGLIKITH